MSRAPVVVSLDVAELAATLARIQLVATAEDYERLKAVVDTLVEITRLLRQDRATIARLRRMLGQTNSEKMADVLGNGAVVAPNGSSDVAPESPAPAGAPEPAKDASVGGPPTAKPPRKGHGRIPAANYAADVERVAHHLKVGQKCPGCLHGCLHAVDEPACIVRVVGQPPLVALRWECERLRCGGCGHVFTARPPPEAQGPKYTDSAAAMMAVLRYGMGMPLHRLEKTQQYFQIPVPASTQWELVRDRMPAVLPAYRELARLAANAEVLHNDDTYVRILDLMGKRRDKLVARSELDEPERTGLFTTGIVAKTAIGLIALFSSGRQHAGENLSDLLDHRDPNLPPPIQMCDGLDRNLPEHAVVLANCLAHGRRHVVDEVNNHPDICAHLLEEIGTVFHNEAKCRVQKLSSEERLRFHQRESGPVMEKLHRWMNKLFDDKRVEPNSGLGDALNYLLKRWEPLTLFLRLEGAPLDNNLSERSLKRMIRQRRNSLFFRSALGARVGDIYLALIYTTELHGGNPLRYLTALMANEKDVAACPAEWLPWNYEIALARSAVAKAA